MLGYIALMPGADGRRDATRAIELCKRHADAGDPYALFVLAWALLFKGNHHSALVAMSKAARARFPPATLDVTTFAWNGWGMKGRQPLVAVRLLRLADQVGHKGALVWRSIFYRSGKLGVVRRPLGYMLTPFARVLYFLALWADPVSCRVFMFQTQASGALFRTTPRNLSAVAIAKPLRPHGDV